MLLIKIGLSVVTSFLQQLHLFFISFSLLLSPTSPVSTPSTLSLQISGRLPVTLGLGYDVPPPVVSTGRFTRWFLLFQVVRGLPTPLTDLTSIEWVADYSPAG